MGLKFLAWTNLLAAFLLELAALYILGYWGFQSTHTGIWNWFLGLGAPLLFLSCWSIWAAPKSRKRLKGWKLWTYKFAVFSLVAFALGACGKTREAFVFEGIVLANLVFLRIWQRFEPK